MFISPDIGKRVIICDDNYNSNGKSKALKKKDDLMRIIKVTMIRLKLRIAANWSLERTYHKNIRK